MEVFQYAIRKLIGGIPLVLGVTFIYTTSDAVESMMLASEIAVLADGEIIERGTHTELLEKQGAYYDLYMSQFRSQEALESAAD